MLQSLTGRLCSEFRVNEKQEMYWKSNIINSNLIPFKSKRILIHGGKNYMRSKIFLIAIVIFLVCLLLEQLKRTKKEGLDKLSIGGLSVAIIGVVIILISSIFV